MGRCYEFGVSVDDACEHAMVVSSEGGSCVCAACGSSCPGRFNGCADIVAQPGYIPLSAPVWARPGGERRDPEDTPHSLGLAATRTSRPERLAPSSPPATPEHPDVGAVRSLVEALAERPDRTTEAIEAMHHALEVRDRELGDAFDRLTDAYTELTAQVVADRGSLEEVVAALDRLAERLAALETAQRSRGSMFGLRRPAT